MSLQTLAEKKAWEMAKENGLDMVTINPVFVLGECRPSTLDSDLTGSVMQVYLAAASRLHPIQHLKVAADLESSHNCMSTSSAQSLVLMHIVHASEMLFVSEDLLLMRHSCHTDCCSGYRITGPSALARLQHSSWCAGPVLSERKDATSIGLFQVRSLQQTVLQAADVGTVSTDAMMLHPQRAAISFSEGR